MKAFWKWCRYNHGLFIGVVMGVLLAIITVSCASSTVSPLDGKTVVDANGLALEYERWQADNKIMQKKFDIAADVIRQQAESQRWFEEKIMAFANTEPTGWPALLSSVGIGAIYDNIRKRGLIAGYKSSIKRQA